MLKLNPSEVIRFSKLADNCLEDVQTHFNIVLKNNYIEINDNIAYLKKIIEKLKNNTDALKKIVRELEEVTELTSEELLKGHFDNEFYEDKMLKHYAKKMYHNNQKSIMNDLNKYYDTASDNGKFALYYQRENFLNNYNKMLGDFNYQKYGLTREILEKDITYIYDTRGSNEAYNVVHALSKNCPDNYLDYNFNPQSQIKDNSAYDYNKRIISNYQTNSEMITINGYEYEIAQVLPKDCTQTERLAYNFCKSNVINTMRTLPDSYLKYGASGNSNTIILTSNVDTMNNTGNWGGYYKASSLFGRNNNMLVIDAHGSFIDNEYYTQDILIHEMGHKFDDMMSKNNIFDYLFGKTYYTSKNDDWGNLFDKYKNVLSGINSNGYENYPNVNEFFGDVTVAYFKSPETLKKLCPEVYDSFSSMLGGEYKESYNSRIRDVILTKFNS